MSRLIDADALERDGWKMSRTVRVDKNTMEIQTRKPTDFPTIEPQRMRGKWIHDGCDIPHGVDWMHCSVCGRREPHVPAAMTNYCPNCGADMREE